MKSVYGNGQSALNIDGVNSSKYVGATYTLRPTSSNTTVQDVLNGGNMS